MKIRTSICGYIMIDLNSSPKAVKAMELFKSGYNCSQAVIGAWHEEIGLDFNTAVHISSGFGGGMGRLREVCGSCSGAFMVLSMKYGYTDPKNYKDKKRLYELIQKFAARFKEENGFDSIVCRELLGLSSGASSPAPSIRTDSYYKKRPCPELIGLSSYLLTEFI
mgnify:FL=1